MVKIVIDTSIIIEFIRSGKGMLPALIEGAENGRYYLVSPTVVMLEIWAGRSMIDSKLEIESEHLFSLFDRCPLTEAIAKQAGRIKREYGVASLDAIIAATTLEENAQLVTLNEKDFTKIPGLKLWRGV